MHKNTYAQTHHTQTRTVNLSVQEQTSRSLYIGKQLLIEGLSIQWLSIYKNVTIAQHVPQLVYSMFSFYSYRTEFSFLKEIK